MTTLRLPPLALPTPMAWAGWCLWALLLLGTQAHWPQGLWLRALLWAPLVEECCLRLGLQQALTRRWGDAPAVALSALAFALLHVVLAPGWAAALTLLPALGIGWVYARGRSLGLCVSLHALANWIWWALGYRLLS